MFDVKICTIYLLSKYIFLDGGIVLFFISSKTSIEKSSQAMFR